jgi:transposase
MAIDQDTRQRAEELYVIDGLTLEAVAAETGISERTIQNWSVEDGWLAKRKEYKNAAAEIRRYTTLTKLKLIKDAMTSLDPQKVYAFSALERATAKNIIETPAPAQMADRQINSPQEAIQALQEAIDLKLQAMLSQPGALSLSAIKEFKQATELLDGMKAKYGAAEDKEKPETQQGLDVEQARFWREKVLGVNDNKR